MDDALVTYGIDGALTAAFVLAAIALSFAIYGLGRWLGLNRVSADTRDLASSVVFRIGALHGLILALVFAQELQQYQRLRDSVAEEAAAVANIYYDIDRYGVPAAAEEVRDALARYVALASGREWDRLGREERLDETAWAQREIVYQVVLDLVPDTPRQASLRAHMLEDVRRLADLRDARQSAALANISAMFWIAALVGFVLVILPYFVFAPTVVNLALLASFAGFVGLVVLFIYAFSNPFLPPGELRPSAFESLLEGEIGARAQVLSPHR